MHYFTILIFHIRNRKFKYPLQPSLIYYNDTDQQRNRYAESKINRETYTISNSNRHLSRTHIHLISKWPIWQSC